MHVEWFTDSTAFERLKPEWNELLKRSATDTLFLTWEWQTTWWRHLGSGKLCIVTVREQNGALAAILPLFWNAAPNGGFADTGAPPATLSLVGCVEVSDYLDIIICRGTEEAVYAALLDALTGPAFPAWEQIQFCTLPEASPTHSQFKALAEARGLHVERRLHDVSPLIRLPGTWDEYLNGLEKKQRHEIRRKLRRVEQAHSRWYPIQPEDDLDQALADFIELHQKSQPDKHLFMDARMQGFFAEMAHTSQARQWLRLEFLEIENRRAAAVFNFVYHNQVLVYNSGYDPEQYGNLSPGVALFARSIQEAIAEGRQVYDFLRGDEEYKYRLGARNTNVYELQIRR